MALLGVSFHLLIEDQGLVLSAILVPFDSNQLMSCSWAMSFFQKLCLASFAPVSCSFLESPLSPQCCLYNLLKGQMENRWPLGGKHCVISNPSRCSDLHLPCFLQHGQHQHFSVNPLGQETGTQCLLEVHLLASFQRQLGFHG